MLLVHQDHHPSSRLLFPLLHFPPPKQNQHLQISRSRYPSRRPQPQHKPPHATRLDPPRSPKLDLLHPPPQPLKPSSSNGQIRYRSASAAELDPQGHATDPDPRMRRPPSRQDPLPNRRIALAASAAAFLLLLLLFYVTPRGSDLASAVADGGGRKGVPGGSGRRYAVIFDAGSSGSRVHVYCFDGALDLVPIGKDIELFKQIKPGLSAYVKNPKEAAESLRDLLAEAENVVPSGLWHKTPVRVGATAGLRTLGTETSERILEEVRSFLIQRGSFKFRSDWVAVLDGSQEGAFQWVTVNYLLGNLGKRYSDTVGIVDLGGGSVQMAYAISEKAAADAPKVSDDEDAYVKELFLKGTKYHLYVHSYLHYGLLAARAEILKADDDAGGSCILAGHHGSYKYGGMEFPASSSTDGPSYIKCGDAAVKALKVDEPACTHMKCTFGGVWNGGGGDGQKKLLVASFFFDRAVEAGFVKPDVPFAKVKPNDFKEAAKQACEMSLKDARTKYPRVEEGNLPYLCMDLVYQFTLLVDGFALDSMQDITLVKQVKHGDSYVEAAWPLGSAIEVASSA